MWVYFPILCSRNQWLGGEAASGLSTVSGTVSLARDRNRFQNDVGGTCRLHIVFMLISRERDSLTHLSFPCLWIRKREENSRNASLWKDVSKKSHKIRLADDIFLGDDLGC